MKKRMLPLLFVAALALPIAAIAERPAHTKHPYAAKACGKKVGGAHFKKMDTNNDGVINAQEHAAHAAIMFANMDTDNNGKVTTDEMRAHWKAKRGKYIQCMKDGNKTGKHHRQEHDKDGERK